MEVWLRLAFLSSVYLLFIHIYPMQSAKIVGFPMLGGSQYIAMKRLAEELASRGHEVSSNRNYS
jgi:hypothetical protein